MCTKIRVGSTSNEAYVCVLNILENKEIFVWGFGILGRGAKFTQSEEPSPIPPTLFGFNEYHPDIVVESIDCGVTTLAAINNVGDLYLWGKNSYGQLGLGHKEDQYYPLKVSNFLLFITCRLCAIAIVTSLAYRALL